MPVKPVRAPRKMPVPPELLPCRLDSRRTAYGPPRFWAAEKAAWPAEPRPGDFSYITIMLCHICHQHDVRGDCCSAPARGPAIWTEAVTRIRHSALRGKRGIRQRPRACSNARTTLRPGISRHPFASYWL